MLRFHATARRLCLVLLLLVIAALCVPATPASAATARHCQQLVSTVGS